MFTVNGTSAFSDGVEDVLRQAGVRLVPWQAVRDKQVAYDLVLSASENIDFQNVTKHTVVLPHGLGFNKYVPDSNGEGTRLAGLPPDAVLRAGGATVVLSHPEQQRQLSAVCPASEGRTEVVGDPTLARLLASQGLRDRYRETFGTNDRTLVVLASTWRPDSLLGRWQSLPSRLLAELPADLYQVVVALHPNVWSYYGRAQISWWFSSALDAGLLLLPPDSGWQAALVAADQVIADHGSLGLFAAALDKPILHAGSSAEIVAGTPPAELLREATELDGTTPLREQLDHCRRDHRPGRFDPITDRVFAQTAEADDNLRNLIYRKLNLTAPSASSSPRRFPLPEPCLRPVMSYVVDTVAIEDGVLHLTRYPAAVRPDRAGRETHLVADEAEPDVKILERAAVIVTDRPLDVSEARLWTASALAANPGARVAITATAQGGLAAVRGGGVVQLDMADSRRWVSSAGSAVYCCWLSGDLRERQMVVQAGPRSTSVTLRWSLDVGEAAH
ncbi:hypothetical protein [Amycolatopsis sp. EV170708-02-1]|uniref:hypothetical protein n=1 Tax=Amycolatopsis sp. EV170708-02-1 TaxID=2919322 RepID=UPI001F0BDE63|nr:hypothetical protein [Amycolatopsis sp. EV170708-02-1]UMP07033.1 hypothetical protein MJQ72_20440 [Amycolatopsis sp. EV170708-02-1]